MSEAFCYTNMDLNKLTSEQSEFKDKLISYAI